MTDISNPYLGQVRAPEIPEGLEWVNSEPIRLADLRGKMVILDFWTYCCINCMQMLPWLAEMEREFGDRLAVIGVHAAKFDNEKITANIRAAADRYEIHHPVVNDANHIVWNQYAVSAWPTLMFIDPTGRVWGTHPGELPRDIMYEVIAQALASYPAEMLSNARPIRAIDPPGDSSALRYPGKVIVDPTPGQDRLFVADTGHHRILAVTKEGHVTQIIGSGQRGFSDGTFAEATFALPEGMAIVNDGRFLIVADRANHALRRVDLAAGTVTTIAGTGERGTDAPMLPLPAENVALASPWDLELVGDTLWIAMAGMHQVWTLDLAANTIQLAAGTGAESIHDGSLLEATFAQPSGITALGHALFTADSESSSVRRMDPVEDRVRRLVGRGLFEFGDRDGAGDEARLQHDIGIASDPLSGALYIADSYNHRIKRLEPETRTVTTIAGSGDFGFDDGDLLSAKFWEPSGLAVDGHRLYVADTNNHALRVVDLETKQVTTLDIR